MSFDDKFRLLELTEDESAKTFTALEIATGRKITVFLFPGELARKQADFLERLRNADRREFPELLEIGDNRGTPYIVTEPFPNLSKLKERIMSTPRKTEDFTRAGVWRVPPLPSNAGQAEKPSISAVPAGPPPEKERERRVSSFREIFQAAAQPIGEPIPDAAKTLSPSEPSPGEFTRLFQTAAPSADRPAADVSKPPESPAAVPSAAPPEPGEFTRLFNASGASGPMPPTLQPHQPEGEWTRLFNSGAVATSAPSPAAPIPGPSDFAADIRQKPVESAEMTLPPQVHDRPAGEFTRIFGDSSPEASTPSPAPAQPAAVPGEYTRMFGTPLPAQEAPAEASPPPAQTAQEPAPGERTSYLVPVLIGVIVFLLAVLAVILVMTRK